MKRIFITSIYVLIFKALWQFFLLLFPSFFDLLFLPPVVLAFCLIYFKINESSIICLFCSMIVDVLGGYLIGINMLLMTMLLFVLNVLVRDSGWGNKRHFFVAVLLISFVYRLLLVLFQLLFVSNGLNVGFCYIILGPFVDAGFGSLFSLLLVRILLLFNAFELGDLYRHSFGLDK